MHHLQLLLVSILSIFLLNSCGSEPNNYIYSAQSNMPRYTSDNSQLENNKDIAIAVSKSIMNGDWAKLDSLLAEEFTYDGDGLHFNKDEYMGFMQDLYLAMRNMKMKFTQVYAEGEFVTIRFENPMLNVGSFMGGPATDKEIVAEGIFIRQVHDGKVIKENQTTDIMGMMKQMGFGSMFGFAVAVGLFDVEQDKPVRKTIAEMKKLDAELENE